MDHPEVAPSAIPVVIDFEAEFPTLGAMIWSGGSVEAASCRPQAIELPGLFVSADRGKAIDQAGFGEDAARWQPVRNSFGVPREPDCSLTPPGGMAALCGMTPNHILNRRDEGKSKP